MVNWRRNDNIVTKRKITKNDPQNTNTDKAKQTKLLASRANFQKFWWGREAPFFVVLIISVGSNAVAAYTGNHQCLRHKRFTDNDSDQQIYRNDRKRTQYFFPNVKTINATVKTHAVVPEKLTIIFFWPN